MRSVVIIGGGLSGALVALHLIRLHSVYPLSIVLVDPNRQVGRGLAYSTTRVCHRMNVRTRHLGVFPDTPDDFFRWLSARDPDAEPDGFAAREQYGRYVEETLQDYFGRSGAARVEIIPEEAVDATEAEEGATVILRSGRVLTADAVVCAFGNFPPAHLPVIPEEVLNHPGYIGDPWRPGAMEGVADGSGPVLLIGTGLTMVDVALGMRERAYTGNLMALSNHGRLPAVHRSEPRSYPSFYDELNREIHLPALVRIVRRHLRTAQQAEIGWQAVIDALRPHIQSIWLSLPVEERRRFLRHIRHFWDGARHRMAPECGEGVENMLRTGQLTVTAGRVEEVAPVGNALAVRFRRRGSRDMEHCTVQSVVNCTGPRSDYRNVDKPLIASLLRRGILCCDPLFLGADALPDGRLLNADGKPSKFFYTLGPPLKGVLWESTAVREIRQQAADLAATLLAGQVTAGVAVPLS